MKQPANPQSHQESADKTTKHRFLLEAELLDQRPEARVQRKLSDSIQQGARKRGGPFDRAWEPVRQCQAARGGPVVQRLMDTDQWRGYSDINWWRRRISIEAIDNALEAYGNALPNQRIARLNTLIQQINQYITAKERDDPNNPRLPKAYNLKFQAINEQRTLLQNPARTIVRIIDDLIQAGTLTDDYIDAHTLTSLRAELAGNAPDALGKQAMARMAALTTKLPILKELFSIRFAIPVGQIGALPPGQHRVGQGNVQNPVDWTLAGLRQTYTTMETLPDSHTHGNQKLLHMLRYEGGGGWYRDTEDKVAVGYANDPNLAGVFGNSPGAGAFVGKNAFDKTVRHEVGHAVDAKIGAPHGSAGYCATAQGGAWQSYGSSSEAAEEIFQTGNGPFYQFLNGIQNQQYNPFIYDEIGRHFSAGATIVGLRGVLEQYYLNKVPEYGQLQIGQQNNLFADPGFGLVGIDSEQVWKNGTRTPTNNRVYVTYQLGWASFDPGAWARRVSYYQFRAPAEWWAEAYAAYYTPNANGMGHGDQLQAHDNTTYQHFQQNVNQ